MTLDDQLKEVHDRTVHENSILQLGRRIKEFERPNNLPKTRGAPRKVKPRSKEMRFIEYAEEAYFKLTPGKFPTPEEAARDLHYQIPEIQTILLNKNVQKMLDRRGLPWHAAGSRSGELTSVQIATAITLSNFSDPRSQSEKLHELGVTSVQFNAWLEDPIFNEFMQRRADAVIRNIRPTAATELGKLVEAGDFGAVKYYLDSTNEFAQATSNSPEITRLMQVVIEILVRHIKDPELLNRIGADLLSETQRTNKVIESNGS